jgi:hypothetical protein
MKLRSVKTAVGLETKCRARAPINDEMTITRIVWDATLPFIPSRRHRWTTMLQPTMNEMPSITP